MDEELAQFIKEADEDEKAWKARSPEPTLETLWYEEALQILLSAGFIVEDESTTWQWKRESWIDGRPTYHQGYRWTPEGRHACFRYRDSTPQSWAKDIVTGHVRHCVVCGRDCYNKKVYASDGGRRCVCLTCGTQGHGLLDLARNEQELAKARQAESLLAQMESAARRHMKNACSDRLSTLTSEEQLSFSFSELMILYRGQYEEEGAGPYEDTDDEAWWTQTIHAAREATNEAERIYTSASSVKEATAQMQNSPNEHLQLIGRALDTEDWASLAI